jgi:putative aldouronate transport system substrate-binding protein
MLLVLALILTIFAACNNDESSATVQETAKETASATGSNEETDDSVEEMPEVVELTAFYSAPEIFPDWKWGEDPVTSMLTEQLGISLSIEYATNSDSQEFYTMVASGEDFPDLLYFSKFDPMLVNEQFVLPMNKIADESYPEFYDLVPYQYLEVHTLSDGNVYYLTQHYADSKTLLELKGGQKGVSSIAINQAQYEDLGMPAIDTLEDVKQAALMAQEAGSGYPILLTTNGPTHQLSYGQIANVCFGGPGFVYPMDDGTVSFNAMSEEYKAGMAYLNELYRLGLIKAENFTYTNSSSDENMKQIATTGDAFILFGHEWIMRQFRTNLGVGAGAEDAYLYQVKDVPIGEGVDRNKVKMDDYNASQIGTPSWWIMDGTEYPKESLELLMNLAKDETQLLFFYGEEGVQYTIDYSLSEDGFMVSTPEYNDDAAEMTPSELIKKYGAMNSVLTTLRTRTVQGWFDRPYYGPAELNGNPVMLGDYMINLGIDYGTPFKTGKLAVNITDTDEKLLYDNVVKAWQDAEPSLVLAESEAEFEEAYSTMISNMEKVGLGDLEVLLTERYNYYDNQLEETRND